MTAAGVGVLPADRFVEAQLWWVASELCRRHPELRLVESELDGLGTFVEAVGPQQDGEHVRVGFSRVGGVMIKGSSEGIGTGDLFGAVDAHAHVKHIELVTGLGSPHHAPPTTKLAQGYRLVSFVLNSMINSRFSWTVRGERWSDSHVCKDVSWLGEAAEWPSVTTLRGKWWSMAQEQDLYAKYPCQGWLLMRDLEPVLFVDTFGQVHRANGEPVEARDAYRGGRIALVDFRFAQAAI